VKAWVRRPVVEGLALVVLIGLLCVYLVVLLQAVSPVPPQQVGNCPVTGIDGRLPEAAPSFCRP
jgi:hypothetical protein